MVRTGGDWADVGSFPDGTTPTAGRVSVPVQDLAAIPADRLSAPAALSPKSTIFTNAPSYAPGPSAAEFAKAVVITTPPPPTTSGPIVASPAAIPADYPPPVPDASIITQRLIDRSIAGYSGNCPCPYNTVSAGRSCGGRSAYSRPGGAAPLCYPKDVTPSVVASFR